MKTNPVNVWWLCVVSMIIIAGCAPVSPSAKEQTAVTIEGRIEGGTYLSRGRIFLVDVPVMRNPFIKQPTAIWDESTPNGGTEVTFAVLDLGEAHRFGAFPLDDSADIEKTFNEELERWIRKLVNTFGKADILREEEFQLADGAGLARVYLVESASVLFRMTEGDTSMGESALIGVVVVPVPQKMRVLYVVSQFDMPNRGGFHSLETERGRESLARQHVHRMQELTETFRLQ
jgi:hypothetical protein